MADPTARHFVRGFFIVLAAALLSMLGLALLEALPWPIPRYAAMIVFGLLGSAIGLIGMMHIGIAGLLAFGILKEPRPDTADAVAPASET